MNESEKYIFTKMCEMVDVKFEDVDFSAHDWFLQHTWTQKQEKEFCDWLIEEIRTNNKLRKDITTLPYRPAKYRVKKAVMWFNLNWGWQVSDRDSNTKIIGKIDD